MKKIIYLCLTALSVIALPVSKARAQSITGHSVFTTCSVDDSFIIEISGYAAGQTVETYYGDGTSDINTINFTGGTNGGAIYPHYYTASGSYTIKQVLISGGVHVDSVTFTTTFIMCQPVSVRLYNDINADCIFDGPDMIFNYDPGEVEIDSAGVAVDTVTTTWLVEYTEYGPVGTIYTFKVIDNPHGFLPSCPSTGIVYDTVNYAPNHDHDVAFTCDASVCLDNALYGNFSAGVTGAGAEMWAFSTSCTPVSVSVALTFSPKYAYSYSWAYGSSITSSVSGNVLTINIASVSASNPIMFGALFTPVGTLTLGDTVNAMFRLSPFTGDCDTANNIIVSVDTIRSSYDPNHKTVTPTGNITAGTILNYTIGFENTGNDTAHNIHIMDTLSDNLDITTIRQTASSAAVTMILLSYSGHNVVKFDFPDIDLLDSSHHGQCDGMVAYSIQAKSALAAGTTIDNKAGIYFDINPVVMTNNVENTIGTTASVAVMSNTPGVEVYPNPANDAVTIRVGNGMYNTATFTNLLGQQVIAATYLTAQTQVNVSTLPAGIYYITLTGKTGVKVIKFEKM